MSLSPGVTQEVTPELVLALPRKQGMVSGPFLGKALGSRLLWDTGFLLLRLLPSLSAACAPGSLTFPSAPTSCDLRGAVGLLSASISTQEGGEAMCGTARLCGGSET